MKSKNVTIDELAMMVQRGFEENQKELAKTAKKIDVERIEKKLDRIFAKHEERIEKLEGKMEKLDELLIN